MPTALTISQLIQILSRSVKQGRDSIASEGLGISLEEVELTVALIAEIDPSDLVTTSSDDVGGATTGSATSTDGSTLASDLTVNVVRAANGTETPSVTLRVVLSSQS